MRGTIGSRRNVDAVDARIASWNVGSLTKILGEVVDVLRKRRVDVCCVQEARWKGEGAKMIGCKSQNTRSTGKVERM
jgi:exonuclease III